MNSNDKARETQLSAPAESQNHNLINAPMPYRTKLKKYRCTFISNFDNSLSKQIIEAVSTSQALAEFRFILRTLDIDCNTGEMTARLIE